MARQNRAGRPVPVEETEGDPESGGITGTQASELEQQIADDKEARGIGEIENLLAHVGGEGGQFAVKRIDPLTGKQSHLERMPITALRDYGNDPAEVLRARYGGGGYNI